MHEILYLFQKFRHGIEKQTDKPIRVLRSDHRDILKRMVQSLDELTFDMSQLKGISERRNRTILDMIRSMMNFTDLSLFLQGYALLIVMHILNRVHTKSIPTTPYEIWYDKKPSLSYLKTWICPTYVKRQKADRLEDRSIIAQFIGYPKESMGYCFYFSHDHNVIMSRNATFLKKQFIQDDSSGRLLELDENISKEQRAIDPQKSIHDEPVVIIPPPPRRSSRISHPP